MKKKTTNDTTETKTRKRTRKVGVGKVITGVAVGSVVGATVGFKQYSIPLNSNTERAALFGAITRVLLAGARPSL